ncbi:MAG: ABC transporter ATP-binding protein [Treponema sp.]|nr:ABC transporter ATP-binding protein [Candidatus Treponema equifaecale]
MSVKIEGFTKRYKDFLAVEDFSMECREGQITGILGPNGAGKTTILKAICGRHFATSGTVIVNETEAEEEIEDVRNSTGFVMEEPDLPGEYTVQEYLQTVLSLHNSEKVTGDYVKNLFEKLSLDELKSKKIKKLSKGQKQRVNFAQALIYNPKVLVLDEPATGLDPAQILTMRKLVQSLKQNHTILISTHLMQEVEALCDYIYIMNHGRCVAKGTKEQIILTTNAINLEEAFFKLTAGTNE